MWTRARTDGQRRAAEVAAVGCIAANVRRPVDTRVDFARGHREGRDCGFITDHPPSYPICATITSDTD